MLGNVTPLPYSPQGDSSLGAETSSSRKQVSSDPFGSNALESSSEAGIK